METEGAAPLLLRETRDAADRSVALTFLEAKGWPRPLLVEWASTGAVLELYDPADDVPRGAAIVDAVDDGTYELRAWAADVDVVGPSVPGRLVRAIADALRRTGARRVRVSIGDANPERLTLLLDAGFRFASIERDAPFASGGRPCDRSRDLVWMDQDL